MIGHRDGQDDQNNHLNYEHRQDWWPTDAVVSESKSSGLNIGTSPFRVSSVIARPPSWRCELLHTIGNSDLVRLAPP